MQNQQTNNLKPDIPPQMLEEETLEAQPLNAQTQAGSPVSASTSLITPQLSSNTPAGQVLGSKLTQPVSNEFHKKPLLIETTDWLKEHIMILPIIALVVMAFIGGAILTYNLYKGSDPQVENASSREQVILNPTEGQLQLNVDTVVSGGKVFQATGDAVFQSANNSATAFQVQDAAGNNLISVNAQTGTVTIVGLQVAGGNMTLQGNAFNGAGQLVQLTGAAALPILNGTNLTGLNASNITIGTIANARLGSGVTLQGNAFNGAGQLVQLDGAGALPILNGTNLTGLNATNLTLGTIDDARLSTNVALLDGDQTFTGTIVLQNTADSASAFSVKNASGNTIFNVDTTGSGSVTLTSSSPYNDEFNTGGPTADARWTYHEAAGSTADYSVNSAVAGKLRFTSSNLNHDCWPPNAQFNCLMLLQAPPSGDFTAEVKIDTTPSVNDTAPGITVYQDANNFIRFEYEFENSLAYHIHKVVAGVGTVDAGGGTCPATAGPIYMRVTKSGNTYTQLYSTDGASFTVCRSITQAYDLSVTGAGVGPSFNGATGTGVLNYDFDYFHLISSSFSFQNSNFSLFKADADSTTAFQVQPSSSSMPVLNVDTYNARVGINSNAPAYSLDVNGSIGGHSLVISPNTSDEFNSGGPTAEPKWTFVGPSGTSYSVNSAATGKLRINDSDATNVSWCFTSTPDCPRLVQTAPSGDFTAEAKIDTDPSVTSIAQGLIFHKDSSNLIRYEFNGAGVNVHKVINGVGTPNAISGCSIGTAPIYLRVTKATNLWSFYYSSDGSNWTLCGTHSQALDLSAAGSKIGLHLVNNTTAQIGLDFDYFHLTDSSSPVILTTQGSALFQTPGNSTTAFQVQNASSGTVLNIDTSTTSNLISNGGFEGGGTTGWSAKGSSTLSRSTAHQWQGNGSLSVATTTAANDGVKYNYTFGATTQYTLSLYAKVASGSITDVNIGRQDNGSDTDCLTGQTVNTNWTRFTCTFTSGGTISGSNIYIKKTGASAETFFIDGVQLEAGSSATAFDSGGRLQLGGLINSPTTFQNKSDSTTAFQIQNAAGTSNLLVADTINGRIGIGASPANGVLTIGTNTTASSGGLFFGTDTNLYRGGSDQLKTDDSLLIARVSTTAFDIQNTSSASFFTVDTAGSQITLGAASGTPVLLILGNKNTSGDPSGTDGATYYNSNSGRFRCYENGAWHDCAGGSLGYASATANQGSITSEADLTSLTSTVTVPANHRIKISAQIDVQSSAASDRVTLRIKESTTVLQACRVVVVAVDTGESINCEVVLTPSGGSHTYKLSLERDTGTGNAQLNASSTMPAYILVEDIGQ